MYIDSFLSGLGFNFSVVERICLLDAVCALLNANGTEFIASVAVGQTSVSSTFSCCKTDGCNNNYLDGKRKRSENGILIKKNVTRKEQYLDLLNGIFADNFKSVRKYYLKTFLCNSDF